MLKHDVCVECTVRTKPESKSLFSLESGLKAIWLANKDSGRVVTGLAEEMVKNLASQW